MHKDNALHLLQKWWAKSLLWISDRPFCPDRNDLRLLHMVLYELPIQGPPEDASLPMELAAKGWGPQGR